MAIIGSTYLKAPAALIPSTLTGFVHKVDLSKLTNSFWDNVDAAGAYIRVKDGAGANVPFDLVYIDTSNRKGLLFFKATLTAGSANHFRIVADDAASAPAASDPLGRNAVWSDYDCFFIGSEPSVNRTGAATTQSNLTMGTTQPFGWSVFSPPVDVHQGVAFDGTHYYVTDNNYIAKYDLDWNRVAVNNNPLAAHRAASGYSNLNHQGDCTIKDGELFIVSEQYTNSPYNSQIIAVHNVSDLSFNRYYDISAQAHEASSICWDATNGYFVVTDYTSAGSTVLHKYSDVGAYLGTIPIASTSQKQGIEYYDGHFYVTTGGSNFYRFNLDGTGRTLLNSNPPTSTMEGLCSLGDGSFLVLWDGLPSALYRAIPQSELDLRYPTWLNTGKSPPFRCVGLPKRSAWTIGASAILLGHSGNSALYSYSDNSTTSGNRATTAYRSYRELGTWNSTDGWLNGSALRDDPNSVGLRRRIHTTYNDTVDRKLWRQGLLEATDLGISVRPGSTGDTLFVGVEDSSPGERFFGLLNFVYLRNGELSADWLLAEQRSWEDDTLFAYNDLTDEDVDFAELDVVIGTDTDPSEGSPNWTKAVGLSDFATSSRGTGLNPAYGSRFFRANAVSYTRAFQGISVAAHSARIDYGDVVLSHIAAIGADYDDRDKGHYILDFLDSEGEIIRSVESGYRTAAPSAWTDASIVCLVPPGTRTIRRRFEAYRMDGTDLNTGFDINYTALYAPEIGEPPPPTGRRRNVAMMIG